MTGSVAHLYLMPAFHNAMNAPRPKWAKANDLLVCAEQLAGIEPARWGKVLEFPLRRKIT